MINYDYKKGAHIRPMATLNTTKKARSIARIQSVVGFLGLLTLYVIASSLEFNDCINGIVCP